MVHRRQYMSIEIEKKFLIKKELWKPQKEGVRIRQGYLCLTPERIVRVRVKGEKAFLTVKGKTEGIARPEFEYEIPVQDAEGLFRLCIPPILDRIRYMEQVGDHLWEIDEFLGDNTGLLVAEVELESQNDLLVMPPWAGAEVSGNERYYNSNLIMNPYRKWSSKEEESS